MKEVNLSPADLQAALAHVERRIHMVRARLKEPHAWHSDDPLPPVPSDAKGILILGAAAALAPARWDELWERLSRYGLSPDAISELHRASLAERLRLFQAIRVLVDEGYLAMEPWGPPDEPRSFAQATISITRKGLERLGLDGVPSLEPRDQDET